MANQSEVILSAQNVFKEFGGQQVLDGVSITLHEGDRLGIIGRNGSGKSTLLKILNETETPDRGLVTRRQGLRVALLSQYTLASDTRTVECALRAASAPLRAMRAEYRALLEESAQSANSPVLAARLAELEHHLEIAGAWEIDQDMKRMTVALDLPPSDRRLDTLSGGELRRVAIAATLLERPDLLLLDEPTNHIDAESARWVEQFLVSYRGGCVLVTHDRYFLDRVVNRICELDRGRIMVFYGNYERFLDQKTARQEQDARAESSRQGTLRRELAWLRRGAKARTTKQKARIKRFDELSDQAPPPTAAELTFQIPQPDPLGKRVLEAELVSFSYGDTCLFRDFSLIMQKGMRVGVVGPNGCGKTSLLRVLMGQTLPDRGKVFIGEATRFLYVDQAHESIDPDWTPLRFVANGARDIDVNGRRVHVPAYLERFLFDRSALDMAMRYLSGGERNRLDLARKLLQGGNFLVLDEPTNDLDLPTLRVMEEAVLAFEGCALIVSHDRYFLNRLCTHVLAFEGQGEIVKIAGNYDDYLRYKAETAPAAGPAKPREPAAPKARASTRPEGQRRLTWKEKKELEAIEASIAEAEHALSAVESRLAAPGFFAQSSDQVQEALADLAASRERVESLYARWAELEAIASPGE